MVHVVFVANVLWDTLSEEPLQQDVKAEIWSLWLQHHGMLHRRAALLTSPSIRDRQLHPVADPSDRCS